MDKKINIINSNYFNQLAITGNINLLMQQQLLIVSFLNEILQSSWVQFMTEEEINTLKYKLFYMLNNFNIEIDMNDLKNLDTTIGHYLCQTDCENSKNFKVLSSEQIIDMCNKILNLN